MALWKPFRGNRTALDAVEMHDGYVYFCTDDGTLFFDYVDSDGSLQRKQINAKDAETLMGMSLDEIKAYVAVQSDWNQNDDTATDYIQNRTHYEATVSTDISGTTYTIEGFTSENLTVTHDPIPLELGQEWSAQTNNESSARTLSVQESEDGVLYLGTLTVDDVPYCIKSTETTFNSNYWAQMQPSYLTLTCTSGVVTTTEVKQLDQKFVPNADWNQNDPSGVGYIKNRPFYTTDPEAIELYNGVIAFQEATQGDVTLYVSQAEQISEYDAFTVGQEVQIIFDTIEYNLTLKVCAIGLYAGNASIINDIYGLSEEDTGEPFLYMVGQGFVTATSETEHTIVAYAYHVEDITIPHKYLGINIWNGGGDRSVIIGNEANIASGVSSVASGEGTTASGDNSHAEGYSTTASGYASHAEGHTTTASGSGAHAEGSDTTASNARAHAEGSSTTASGMESHAEGQGTKAQAVASHAEGIKTTASGEYASHAEGYYANATASYAHAEGLYTVAASESQHAQGKFNLEDATAKYAHIVGNGTNTANRSNAHTLDWSGNAWFQGTIKIGGTSQDDESAKEIATQDSVDNKMDKENPVGTGSFSMQRKSETDIGLYSVAIGYNNTASGKYSEAHGFNTTSTNEGSHAEGHGTTASGYASHAEGIGTNALGGYSHAEGYKTTADAMTSHTEGFETKAVGACQHVQGQYNITNSTYAHIVGNGTADDARSNAHTLDWDGNAWFAGDVKVGGTEYNHVDAKTLATTEYVDSKTNGALPVYTTYFDADFGEGQWYFIDAPEITELTDGLTIQIIPHTDSTEKVPALIIRSADGSNMFTNELALIVGNSFYGDSTWLPSRSNWIKANRRLTLYYYNNKWIVSDLKFITSADIQSYITVDKGGTGATTAEAARTNLEVYSKTEVDDLHTWTQIYDSGEITSEVNSISGIDVSGYKSLRVAVKCVGTANTESATAGAVIFTGENGMEYSFASLFSNLVTNTADRVSGAMARFSVVDGFIICDNASRGIIADGMLSTTEGEGSWALASSSAGLIMCNSPLVTMSVSTTNNSATHFYGVGSRVIVWGCKV